MITTVIKSYFLVIVALGSIVGSAIAAPYISNVANVGRGSSTNDSESSSLLPDASAQAVPFRVDHHVKIKEKAGDPVRIEENINDGERHCEMSCQYIEYKPGSQGRAGLAFITDAPVDLSGAKRVHLFLMGDKGGETVRVKIAGKNPQSDEANATNGNGPNGNGQSNNANATNGNAQSGDDLFKEKFALSTDVITLPNDWKRYEVPLNGTDLKNIVAPFGLELLKGKGSAQQVVYLKYIVYDNEPVDPRFLLPANGTANATTTAAATAPAANGTANATAANNTAVESGSNNTLGQIEETIEGNDSSTSGNATTADSIEAENEINDNNETETAPTSTTNNSAADTTSGEQTSNATDIAPTPGQGDENLAPIALLRVDSMVAHPGDRVILDGSLSSDPDGDQITYQWSQSDGPDANIIGADTVTPTVTIPTLDQNDQITIDLVVSDGLVESNKVSVVIDVQNVEEVEGAIEQDLPPDDYSQGEGWSDATCGSNGGSAVECLTDNSDSTFVTSDRPGRTTDLLLSFQDPSTLGVNSSNQIAYVTAQVTAKKTGPSGFTSLIVDDPNSNEHYSTPSISITSDSFEEYSFTWINNPITGAPWTTDSLNSLVAGNRYLAGQGSIQISEFKLIVGSLIPEVEQEPSAPPSSAIDGETSIAEESEAAVEDNGNDGDSDDEGTPTTDEGPEDPASTDSDLATDEAESSEDNE
jgi:hypothetical protein